MPTNQIIILAVVLGIIAAIIIWFWGTAYSSYSSSTKTSERKSNMWRDFWIGLSFLAVAIIFPVFGAGKYILGQICLFFIWLSTY